MDLLVLMDENTDVEVLTGHAKIVHSASPRLHVIRPDSNSIAELTALKGILAVTADKLPREQQKLLNDQEALFATAFTRRQGSKKRIGNGLPWDTSGFDPP